MTLVFGHIFRRFRREGQLRLYSSKSVCKKGSIINNALTLKEPKLLDHKHEIGHTPIKHSDAKINVRSYEDRHRVSGVPPEYYTRPMYIGQKGKHVMQQGTKNAATWILKSDNRQKWTNPLMGHASTGDGHASYKVQFSRKEDAVEFARKQKMDWSILQEPAKKKFKVKAYRENFLDKRTRVSTK